MFATTCGTCYPPNQGQEKIRTYCGWWLENIGNRELSSRMKLSSTYAFELDRLEERRTRYFAMVV